MMSALAPSMAGAAGYYLPNQDAFATAAGNAFVATADSAAAVFYNPAGLTQLSSPEAQAGVYSIVIDNETNAGGVTSEIDHELQLVPQIYYAQPYNERIGFGFGINSPWGLGADWGRDTPFSPVVTQVGLVYLSATSAVGVQVTDTLSLGASVSLNRADLLLEQGLGVPGSFLRFEGDGYAVSGALSARWQPHEQHAFGLIYCTESSFDLDGETRSNGLPGDSDSDMDFMTPARVAAGYSYRPSPGWNIEFNLEWLNWDELNSLTLDSASVGGSTQVPFEWESSFIYELGASYTTQQGYVFAAGYDMNMSSQPEEYFNPGVSDADRQSFNIGVGRNHENFKWMIAYQFGYSNRTVDDAVGVNALANGKYKWRHNALMFTWTQEF